MRGISSPVRVTQEGPDGLSHYYPVRVICLEIQLCFLTGVLSWLITLPKPPFRAHLCEPEHLPPVRASMSSNVNP